MDYLPFLFAKNSVTSLGLLRSANLAMCFNLRIVGFIVESASWSFFIPNIVLIISFSKGAGLICGGPSRT